MKLFLFVSSICFLLTACLETEPENGGEIKASHDDASFLAQWSEGKLSLEGLGDHHRRLLLENDYLGVITKLESTSVETKAAFTFSRIVQLEEQGLDLNLMRGFIRDFMEAGFADGLESFDERIMFERYAREYASFNQISLDDDGKQVLYKSWPKDVRKSELIKSFESALSVLGLKFSHNTRKNYSEALVIIDVLESHHIHTLKYAVTARKWLLNFPDLIFKALKIQ